MFDVLDRVDAEALSAVLRCGQEIGLPQGRSNLMAVAGRLSKKDEADITAAWRQRWIDSGGFKTYPDVWVVDQLGERPWSGQRTIMRSIVRHRKTAVVSSYGIGKDWTAARVITWFLDQSEPGEAFVVSTAPTFAQVRAILWREVQTAFSKANTLAREAGIPTLMDRGHRLNLTEWWVGKEMVGFGRKPSATNTAAFQGIHARKVLVVLDEAGGIPEALFEDAEKLVTTEHSRILAIGNPTHEGTYWHKVCTDPGWNVMRFSAYDTPNFTGEELPEGISELLTSRLWVEEQKAKYGESSPRFQQQVLGMFTRERMMTTVPLDWARASIHPERYGPTATAAHERAMIERGIRALGVDLASGGSDWTVIRERVGNRVGRMWRTQSPEPKEIVALITTAAFEAQVTRIVIDSIGIGFGIVELVRQAVPHAEVIAADASEVSDVVRMPDGRTLWRWDVPPGIDTLPVFANKRAEWWWAARERSMLASDPTYSPTIPGLQPWDLTALEYDLIGGSELTGEPDPTLDELTTPSYAHVTRGRTQVILVESKDELRKAARLGRSTDHGDAVLLAFIEPPREPPAPIEYGGMAAARSATTQPRTLTVSEGRGGLTAGGPLPLVRRGR